MLKTKGYPKAESTTQGTDTEAGYALPFSDVVVAFVDNTQLNEANVGTATIVSLLPNANKWTTTTCRTSDLHEFDDFSRCLWEDGEEEDDDSQHSNPPISGYMHSEEFIL